MNDIILAHFIYLSASNYLIIELFSYAALNC